jgi:magnesium chelatase family protein
MLAVVKSVGIIGLEGHVVDVEVDISQGLPGMDIVGLPNVSVKESKERVRAAIKNSGLEFPLGRITVNLAPADLKKEGPAFDLAIAVGILAASGQITSNYNRYIFMSELSLDGTLRGVSGILPGAMAVADDKSAVNSIIVSTENADEAALVKKTKIYPANNIIQVISLINETSVIQQHTVDFKKYVQYNNTDRIDLSEVQGQYQVKRALEIAAAGGHNIFMIGPPGSGKTMMARRISQILPELTYDEAMEITKIYSISGLLKGEKSLITQRPFRAPHHSVSKYGMVGGGNFLRPGEISLSHYGILFMDEFPEFSREALESLRQPLEDGVISISRAYGNIELPAKMMLVAAMNPCPCGFLGDPHKECRCSPYQISRYKSKISGPLLDRFDIHIEVPRTEFRDLIEKHKTESSDKIQKRVQKATNIQKKRFSKMGILSNSRMNRTEINKYCKLDNNAEKLLWQAYEKLSLSARAYTRVLKVARTIADLSGIEDISVNHIAEAIQYRSINQ